MKKTTTLTRRFGRPRKRKTTRTKGVSTHACRCPRKRCRAASRVLRTTSRDGNVIRERVCANGHRFETMEAPLVDAAE